VHPEKFLRIGPGMLVAAFHSVAMQWSERTDGQWRETQYRLMRRQQLLLPAPADQRCLPPGRLARWSVVAAYDETPNQSYQCDVRVSDDDRHERARSRRLAAPKSTASSAVDGSRSASVQCGHRSHASAFRGPVRTRRSVVGRPNVLVVFVGSTTVSPRAGERR